MSQMIFPNKQNTNDTASWLNLVVNVGILILTIEILKVNYKNLGINQQTLKINTKNTNNSRKTAELLEEINKKI